MRPQRASRARTHQGEAQLAQARSAEQAGGWGLTGDKLSEKRAELTHAVLTGKRDKFVEIAHETGKVGDWKQIFRWASAAVPGFESVGPPTVDDNESTGKPFAKKFQEAYNANKAELGISGENLSPDGIVGKKTWGAVFDLYQWNMAEELGEVDEEKDVEDGKKRLEGLQKLQGLVSFLPTSKPFVGFGEHFPVDGIGKDNLASAANRRVEVMFFESGQEPDVGILEEAPDVSELYQAGSYEKVRVEMVTARRLKYAIRLLNWALEPMANIPCRIHLRGESIELISDGSGLAHFRSPAAVDQCAVEWSPGGDDAPSLRRIVLFSNAGDVDARLRNLGYEQGGDESLAAFMGEFSLDEESNTDSVLTEWHDRGKKPQGGANV